MAPTQGPAILPLVLVSYGHGAPRRMRMRISRMLYLLCSYMGCPTVDRFSDGNLRPKRFMCKTA